MRGSSLFVAMLVISSGVAPVWGQAKTATTETNSTATPAPSPVHQSKTSATPAPPPTTGTNSTNNNKGDNEGDNFAEGGVGGSSLKSLKDMDIASFFDEQLARACSSIRSGDGGTNVLQSLGLMGCITISRMITEQVNKALGNRSEQANQNVAEERKVVSGTSTTNAIVRGDSYISPFNTANNSVNNGNENSSGNIPVASWDQTDRDKLSPPAETALGTQVGSRGLLTSDNKIEMDRSSYTALLARNEEVHRLASQMVYQILSKQGQDLSHKQLQAMQEALKNGQAIQEIARGYEKATQQLVMAGVKSIDSLGQQMQAEEGKLSSKTGEIQAKQSTQEVLKAISELMKDIGLSTQKAIIGTGSGIASSLSGLTKVAGSVEATVASINNTNNILATMNENQIKSLELAATAISLQQQQMKMQETELLEKYRSNLSSINTISLGNTIGIVNKEEPDPADQPNSNKSDTANPQTPRLVGGQL